jgi:hypothetical protein
MKTNFMETQSDSRATPIPHKAGTYLCQECLNGYVFKLVSVAGRKPNTRLPCRDCGQPSIAFVALAPGAIRTAATTKSAESVEAQRKHRVEDLNALRAEMGELHGRIASSVRRKVSQQANCTAQFLSGA